MAARIKKITLKKMSAKDFAALLKKIGACIVARRWARGKTFQKVWATCENGCWMEWLLNHTAGLKNWPMGNEIPPIIAKANIVYWKYPEGIDLKKKADCYRKYVLVK